MIDTELESLILEHRLPSKFISTVNQWYRPIAKDIAKFCSLREEALVLGVQGCQGSGKSTLSSFLKCILEQHQLTVAVLSIDDFYLTKTERHLLANRVHPLLATRGVPGTHDVPLAIDIIDKLTHFSAPCGIPRFNKAIDDRCAQSDWEEIKAPVDVVILEGWCVGITPQADPALATSVNDLERNEDPSGLWRRYVNQKLREEYSELFAKLDKLIVLKAPSFECVYRWRLLQEEKLIATLQAQNLDPSEIRTMSPEQILRFISHYQRLTEHALATLPDRADWLLTQEADHSISQLSRNKETHWG